MLFADAHLLVLTFFGGGGGLVTESRFECSGVALRGPPVHRVVRLSNHSSRLFGFHVVVG